MVHARSHEGIGIDGLFDGNATDEWRNIAGNFVESTKHDVLATAPHAGALQNSFKPRSRKSRRPHRAALPLNAGDFGVLKTTSITGTLKSIDNRVLFEVVKVREC